MSGEIIEFSFDPIVFGNIPGKEVADPSSRGIT